MRQASVAAKQYTSSADTQDPRKKNYEGAPSPAKKKTENDLST